MINQRFYIWFMAFIMFQPFLPLISGQSFTVEFANTKKYNELIDDGIVRNDIRKTSLNTAQAIQGINFRVFYNNYEGLKNDFNEGRLRNAIRNCFVPICVLIFFFSEKLLSQRKFIQANLLSAFGVVFSILSLIFTYVDGTYLIKVFFAETLKSIPAIESYAINASNVLSVVLVFVALIGFGIFNRNIVKRSEVLRLEQQTTNQP